MKNNKVAALFLLTSLFALSACATQNITTNPKTVVVGFDLPDTCSQTACAKPRQVKGKVSVEVNPGDFFEIEVPNAGGSMLLVILDENKTPFKNGQFVVRLNPGPANNKKLEIANGVKGTYKYMIIDASGNDKGMRPPLDPYIIVRR